MNKDTYSIFKTKTILYIEDDDNVSTIMLNILNKLFKKVHHAKDGELALETFNQKQKEFDCIITDIRMPKLDGIELSKQIRKTDLHTPIIAVTADTSSGTEEKLIHPHFNSFIFKPSTIIVILDTIKEQIQNRKIH